MGEALRFATNGRFLSTLPARGATGCGGPCVTVTAISIHAPREGSDDRMTVNGKTTEIFLSTLPARGATLQSHSRGPRRPAFLSTLPARGATSYRPANFMTS